MTLEESKLDIALLDEMAELGVEDLCELIEVYMEQATETMRQLDAAVTAKNIDDVIQNAHRLAGSSAACGATAAMNSLRALERRGREADWNTVGKDILVVCRELEACDRLLREYMAKKNQTVRVSFKAPR